MPCYGEPNDDNLVFSHKQISVIGLKGTDKRTVLTEVTKDGMLLVDGQSSHFMASNYMVGDIRKGDTAGGARHKSASSMAQFHKGNIVMKAGESECKAKMKEGQELDYFNSEKLPTNLPLIAAEAEEPEEEQDPNLAAEAIERVMELLEKCDVDGTAAAQGPAAPASPAAALASAPASPAAPAEVPSPAPAPQSSDEDMDVVTWLTNMSKSLAVYAPVFEEAGYDDLTMLKELEDQR